MNLARPVVGAAALVCVLTAPACHEAPPTAKVVLSDVPSGPDEIAWRLLSHANSKNSKPWDEWIEAGNLLDPSRTPMLSRWRKAGHDPDTQNMLVVLQTVRNTDRLRSTLKKLSDLSTLAGGGTLSTRYNDSLVGAIKGQQLNTPQGRKAAFLKGTLIDLGSASVAVKAVYENVKPSDAFKYYPDRNIKNRGVVALHLTARILDQWIWATWEHATVAEADQHDPNHNGYCCKDNFGWDKAKQGASSALVSLWKHDQAPEVWWKNYRLVGTQVYPIDSVGNPTKLGNFALELENGFLQRSSCITCHASAAFDANGRPTLNPNDHFVGAPNPNWFWSNGRLASLQLDFLWKLIVDQEVELLLRAQNIDLFAL